MVKKRHATSTSRKKSSAKSAPVFPDDITTKIVEKAFANAYGPDNEASYKNLFSVNKSAALAITKAAKKELDGVCEKLIVKVAPVVDDLFPESLFPEFCISAKVPMTGHFYKLEYSWLQHAYLMGTDIYQMPSHEKITVRLGASIKFVLTINRAQNNTASFRIVLHCDDFDMISTNKELVKSLKPVLAKFLSCSSIANIKYTFFDGLFERLPTVSSSKKAEILSTIQQLDPTCLQALAKHAIPITISGNLFL